MKSKIILALTVLITLAVTSADAQSVRERRGYQRDGISNDFGHRKLSKNDRHRLAKERHHFRRDRIRGHRDGYYGYRDRKHYRNNKRQGVRNGYSYRNNHRRFD